MPPVVLNTTPGDSAANSAVSLSEIATVAAELFPRPETWLTAPHDDDRNRAAAWAFSRLGHEITRDGRRLREVRTEWSTWPPDFQRAQALLAIEAMRLWRCTGTPVAVPSAHAGVQSVSTPELTIALEPGQGAITPIERFIASEIRPVLGALIVSPANARLVRG